MTVSEPQYLHVRNAAKQVIPEDCVDIAPDRIVVAILFSDADLSEPLDKSDFLWVKSKPKNSIAKFQTAYKGKRDHEPTPRFVVGAKVIERSARASDLDFYHDNMVVLMVDNEPTTDGASSGAAAPTAAPGPVGHAMNGSATNSRVDPAHSGFQAVQTRHALSVGTSPASSLQSSLPTSARPSPSLPKQNGMFTGTGGLERHPQYPTRTGSPISWLSRTPTPTQTSSSSMPTPQSSLTAAPSAQLIAQHAQTHSPYRQPPTQKSPYTAAKPVQPVAQHTSIQSPYRQVPTSQPASGFPGTPANAHNFPALIYGSTLGGPTSGPSGSRHPGDPPAKPHQQYAPMPNHAHQPGLNTHHTPAHAPAAQTVKAEARTQNQSLETLMAENEIECLEAGVKQALKLLEKIEQPLQACQQQDQDAQEWLKSIHDLKSQNVKNRTILGVVGNTGAGKSSVINAMLDEERLVPTNCMRACTAVVTELSWNESNDDYSRYRAEIEFVKLEDWLKELQVLYSDLLDGSGKVSKECTNSEHEAGVAWAKIKAVYPQKTKEMIAEASPESLAREVQGLLGTTKRINESNPGDFYKRLQYFVDSQEKQKDSKEKKRMEYWPLIKVVKIYTKADALSTGAVVVDLPGVQDSNAARAAVAEGYMKQCSGLWIVAPITRAVDDKAAKKLLGDTFKRQLKLDGTYNNVTFICSKTDDISLVEAVSGLNLDETVSGMWSELDDLRSKVRKLQNEIEECKDSKQVYMEAVEDCDEKIDVWDNLLEDCADGKIVYAPTENSGKKRKRSKSPKKQSRKKRRAEADSDAHQSEPEDEVPDDREPLTEQQIQDKIQELKNMKKEAKAERASIDEKMKDIRKDIKTLREKEASIDDHISRLCINGRNDYSRGAIAQDFAAGIRELDQETAEEENEDEFDPEVDLRDYDEVARSLPVFCVSSRAYQKLCGRLRRDKAVPGFKDVSETEVPKLQAHCKQLTEAGRIACARRFLNSLNQFLTSMSLWATNDGPSSLISADQRRQEQTFLKQKLEELGKCIQKVVHENLHGMAATLTEHVYANYDKLVPKACEAAHPTASGWGAHRSMGGLYWSTYKATVRRQGVYNGASGPRDFNAELTAPILKEIATGWERAFQRRLPTDVRNFKANALKVLHSFHNAVVQRAR
ncbi:uncharacterized protein J3D65DRAFT_124748 [Phyllosticta citribraziliensis]|uniref:Dynamin N-terminal domain-containing protein n=1 Tax=Phyllosticta citribraziliensis TaxID=989973 RepID=A0ABR1L913_9PEZI